MRSMLLVFTSLFFAVNAFALETAVNAVDSTVPKDSVEFVAAEPAKKPYVLRVGPTLGIVSGGIAMENADGRKVNPDVWFMQNYGVMVFAPFSKGSSLGGRLDVGVTTAGTRTRPYEFYDSETDWKGYIIERYTYFSVAPQVSLYGIMIGAGFNFPMKGEMWHPERSDDVYVVDKNTMKMAIDIRLGGAINLWNSSLGILTLDLLAKYYVTGVYEDGMYTNGYPVTALGAPKPSTTSSDVINLTPVTVHLGLSYQFKLGF